MLLAWSAHRRSSPQHWHQDAQHTGCFACTYPQASKLSLPSRHVFSPFHDRPSRRYIRRLPPNGCAHSSRVLFARPANWRAAQQVTYRVAANVGALVRPATPKVGRLLWHQRLRCRHHSTQKRPIGRPCRSPRHEQSRHLATNHCATRGKGCHCPPMATHNRLLP